MRWRPALAAAASLGLLSLGARAGDAPPLTNHAALARGFALPVLGEPVSAGGSTTQVTLGLANEFQRVGYDASGTCTAFECLTLDGETYHLVVRHRRGFAERWEWSVELPLLAQGGGFMDAAIEGWHEFFGLPNGGREHAPQDQFAYRYERGGAVLLDVTEPKTGAGDARLGIGWQAGEGLALRAQVKLPTGDEEHLLGGNAGGALWFDLDVPLGQALHGYGAAGASIAGRGDVLPEQQNRVVAFGGLGLAHAWTPAFSVHLQLYLHDRLYDESTLRALDRAGMVLGLGARLRTGAHSWLDVGFQEDLSVNVSPDFVLQTAFTWRR